MKKNNGNTLAIPSIRVASSANDVYPGLSSLVNIYHLPLERFSISFNFWFNSSSAKANWVSNSFWPSSNWAFDSSNCFFPFSSWTFPSAICALDCSNWALPSAICFSAAVKLAFWVLISFWPAWICAADESSCALAAAIWLSASAIICFPASTCATASLYWII